MTISIDWANRIIYVPRADLTLIQSTPVEVREMDLNWFRLQLKNLEDSEEGMPFLDTHNHNTEISVGGIVLARVIEIINDYTVTFEDGQYAVNLIGANSNVGDRVNANQVSIRTFNSAGLISTSTVDPDELADAVLNEIVEGTLSLKQAVRIMVSVLTGKTTGGGTNVLRFRDLLDSKDRIVATVDNDSNRIGVTLDSE